MPKTKLSDIELWDAVCKDDEPAFSALYERYWIILYNTANQYLKNHEASEEVVHDVFLNIWSRRHTVKITTFHNYILTAVRYHIYNIMRSSKPALLLLNDEQLNTEVYNYNAGEHKVREAELLSQLHQYIHVLPRRCKEIFIMSREKQLSNAEISERLGISKKAVENQLNTALKHLRICFKHLIIIIAFFINRG